MQEKKIIKKSLFILRYAFGIQNNNNNKNKLLINSMKKIESCK